MGQWTQSLNAYLSNKYQSAYTLKPIDVDYVDPVLPDPRIDFIRQTVIITDKTPQVRKLFHNLYYLSLEF